MLGYEAKHQRSHENSLWAMRGNRILQNMIFLLNNKQFQLVTYWLFMGLMLSGVNGENTYFYGFFNEPKDNSTAPELMGAVRIDSTNRHRGSFDDAASGVGLLPVKHEQVLSLPGSFHKVDSCHEALGTGIAMYAKYARGEYEDGMIAVNGMWDQIAENHCHGTLVGFEITLIAIAAIVAIAAYLCSLAACCLLACWVQANPIRVARFIGLYDDGHYDAFGFDDDGNHINDDKNPNYKSFDN